MIGGSGQKRLKDSTAAVIGCGGLGCNVMTHLASAGVGNIIIADDQTVEMSNLNRQFIYSEEDIGKRKVRISAEWIRRMSPDAEVTELETHIDDQNSSKMGKCDVIIDCLDNYASRMAVNRYAFNNNIPLVHGGVESMFGQVTVIIPKRTPCLECILPPRNVNETASISPVVGMIGAIQATEAIKLLTGSFSPLSGKLLTVDVSCNKYVTTDVKKREGCACCSGKD